MIYIENETAAVFDIPDYEEVIRHAAQTVLEDKHIPEGLDVNIIIAGPDQIRQVNSDARGIDSVTDVLSFPYFEYDEPGVFCEEIFEDGENILGDMMICADRVIAQAEEYGHSQMRELAFLVVHSMLHIVGYDHTEESDGDIMRAEEKRLMEITGISR